MWQWPVRRRTALELTEHEFTAHVARLAARSIALKDGGRTADSEALDCEIMRLYRERAALGRSVHRDKGIRRIPGYRPLALHRRQRQQPHANR